VSQKESRPVPGSVKEGGGAQEYQKESRPVPGSVKEERRSTRGRVPKGGRLETKARVPKGGRLWTPTCLDTRDLLKGLVPRGLPTYIHLPGTGPDLLRGLVPRGLSRSLPRYLLRGPVCLDPWDLLRRIVPRGPTLPRDQS
jgi:hypothetical protein